MEVKKLSAIDISKIRSSLNVSNVTQCVFELVCNSLDAKSSSIAIRVNLITFKIQVADNGDGIKKENMEHVGLRYMTNKCQTLKQLEKKLNTYGYRGEALASIIENSIKVSVISRSKQSTETLCKRFTKDRQPQIAVTKNRPSVGTTVTVSGFMNNFPVRQKRVVEEVELEEIKQCVENLIIINPGTSFSLRNDSTGWLVLQSPHKPDIISAFRLLHADITDDFTLLKVRRKMMTVETLVHKEYSFSNKYQYVYVNKWPAHNSKLQNHILKLLQRKFNTHHNPIFETKKYPIYVVHIKCPLKYVDVVRSGTKVEVMFQCWDLLLACINKAVETYLGSGPENKEKQLTDCRSYEGESCRLSKVYGVIQARAFKRKSSESIDDDELNLETKRHFIEDKTKPSNKTDSSGYYQIEDSCRNAVDEPKRKIISILRKPLPITIYKPPAITKEHKPADQISVYSKLNDNEHDGKHFIMDMFLKSTQVFDDTDHGIERQASQETIMESNLVMEKDIQDCVNGINATMSISINVKKKKLRHQQTPGPIRKMVSKFIQTTQKPNTIEMSTIDEQNNPDNYTVVLNTAKSRNKYKFVRKSNEFIDNSEDSVSSTKNNDICHCYKKGGKIFNFNETNVQRTGIDELFKKPSITAENEFEQTKSSYFRLERHPVRHRNIESDFMYQPKHISKNSIGMQKEESPPIAEISFNNIPEHYFIHPEKNNLDNNIKQKYSVDLFPTQMSYLQFTMPDDSQKKKMLTEEQDEFRQRMNLSLCNLENVTTQSPPYCYQKQRSKIIFDSQNEWLPMSTENGTEYYVNQRTGMTSKVTPKESTSKFGFDKRFNFIPKGMSPVLDGHKPVEKILSQNSRNKLQEFILKSYENELLVVKWQNYISNDPEEFFKEMYKEKAMSYENIIPSIKMDVSKWRTGLCLERTKLNNIVVLGQLDNKFIVTLQVTEGLLILFDQHAVDERIRLERFLTEYKGKKSRLKRDLTVFMPRTDLSLLRKNSNYLQSIGLEIDYFTNGLKVISIPLIIAEKYPVSACFEEIRKILLTLLKDIIDTLKTTEALLPLPKIIHNILSLKACRGAIKFGHVLSEKTCTELLQQLKSCQLPFQCAHGRPTMLPVLELNQTHRDKRKSKIHLRKLISIAQSS
ncbi:hypothetical protein GWI33_021389 [Rhynchophorus ferrugineus]|uniref:DNA mismatch repair protein Mlh3 n=1 Tax=Rhynchophorus ferrugineus TaxID=354439 RepID=A0A834LYN5_RHYFE|nr:hypothetical protein GWI33_021389 [Rhynchophorus ferrugineus]